MRSINPATNEVIREYESMSLDRVEELLDQAQSQYQHWKFSSLNQRSEKMRRLAALLRQKKGVLGKTITEEMGKPLRDSVAEVEKCAWVCEYYADNAEKFLRDQICEIEGFKKAKVSFRPIGIVFGIMPWNFPFWQVFRFAVPTIMAGNVVALKHAENVPECALVLQTIFEGAEFPPGVFTTLLIDRHKAQKVIENPLVAAVTLTGSTQAGKAVAAAAGSVLKKSVLELGGSDPYVVLKDADVDEAVKNCLESRFLNNGQSCISAKRFIVHHELLEEFTQKMLGKMSMLKFGDPLAEDVQLGPMARLDLRDQLHAQVQKTIDQGALCVLGGQVPDGPGAFYPPTLLKGVTEDMVAFQEEMFGPVASIIEAKNDDDAIRLANRSSYGLGGAVFTRDLKKGEDLATERIETGCCVVNGFVKSDPRLPFGGIRQSGYGRELSAFGIHEFVNIKTVVVN